MKYSIPFNRPSLEGNEKKYLIDAVMNGHISGDGPFTKKCNALLERELGVSKALLTTSCTHALEMAAILLDIKPGDEVIVPAFTFVSTVNAFVLHGATPVFVDVRQDTLNMEELELEKAITKNTRAIVPVHYAGVSCEMDSIMKIANHYKIPVIEDNAHGLFGCYKGKFLGTFGCMSTLSFHETKNFYCGEGGALLINEPRYIERAEIIREKGTNRSRFFRGQVDKYTWVDIGSSYLPSDLLAAFLYAQLEARASILTKRKRIWDFYNENLKDWACQNDVRLPFIPSHCDQSYHMYYLLFSSAQDAQDFMDHLKNMGILSVFHYQPLHLSEMGQKFGGKVGDCPITEDVSQCIVRLPFYNNLAMKDQKKIISTILKIKFRKGKSQRRVSAERTARI